MGAQNQAPQVPALDPAIKQMADQQLQQSQDFTGKAGDVKQQYGNIAQQSSAQKLADTTSNINKNANSRGLLYSGLRQGAVSQAQGQSAGALADTQSKINQSVDDQAAGLRSQALNSQMGVQDLQTKRNALAYNIKNQNENSGGLLHAIGLT